MKKKEIASIMSGAKTEKEIEEAQKDGIIGETVDAVDFGAPHPDFVLNKTKLLTSKEFDDICKEIKNSAKFTRIPDHHPIPTHALLRGLRRGIGVYINNHNLTSYRVVVMRLA